MSKRALTIGIGSVALILFATIIFLNSRGFSQLPREISEGQFFTGKTLTEKKIRATIEGAVAAMSSRYTSRTMKDYIGSYQEGRMTRAFFHVYEDENLLYAYAIFYHLDNGKWLLHSITVPEGETTKFPCRIVR
ncbi:hypothetical protein KAW65_08560 [candidate division WOR-3 bacterium]|nr:hypothetical protein [candidate division WOR-3 bacterium]